MPGTLPSIPDIHRPVGLGHHLLPPYQFTRKGPGPFFNLIRFDNKIQAASEERLVMYHVIPSLHRIHFKAAAILTSIVAFEFRRRWDMPNFNSGFEKPFQWTDEAEPLLALHSRNPRSIIIDSVHPCTIPHVVITQAPPQDPWEALVSNTVNPQDCGYGYYLTVPSPLVDFINNYLPDSPLDDDSFMADSDGYESEGLSESESISDDDSPMLLTPPGQAIEFDDAAVTDGCIPATSPNFPLCDDDDDDDDLPPFDDWYLDIAQRASLSSPV